MKINEKFNITKRHDGTIVTNLLTGRRRNTSYRPGDDEYYNLERVLFILRKRKIKDTTKNNMLERVYNGLGFTEEQKEVRKITVEVSTESEPTIVKVDTSVKNEVPPKKILKETMQRLIDFFAEFNFSPSFRFVNTLAYTTDANEYVRNYFAIQDHQYANEVAEKIKSVEFEGIIKNIKTFSPTNEINSRMKIYYGEPGTGKTTQAIEEADKCVVCSSDMLPTDLMQNFAFAEGKAEFQKSDLWRAMENGETIVLDEINMLPFESLRFLQGITDGKSSIDYKGYHIEIKEGFKISGTMNLNVGGIAISVPAPLVDRCSEIKEFAMNAECLMNALA